MTSKRFLAGLRRLGYSTHNAHKLMSLSRTTIFRIAKGTTAVPLIAAKLLDMYERHGVPDEHKEDQ